MRNAFADPIPALKFIYFANKEKKKSKTLLKPSKRLIGVDDLLESLGLSWPLR